MHVKGLQRFILGMAALTFLWAMTGCKYAYEPGTYIPRDPIAERRAELRSVK